MTLSQLIKDLQEFEKDNSEAEVILQIDPEGNGYDHLQGVTLAIRDQKYHKDCSYPDIKNDCYVLNLSEEEWEALKANKDNRVIIIFP